MLAQHTSFPNIAIYDLLLVSVGTLLAILRFLPCRTTTMGTSDVFLLLCLGLDFAVIIFSVTLRHGPMKCH